MAVVAFSFTNTDVIKLTPGATMGTLGNNVIIEGVSFVGTAIGNAIRITDIDTARTVFYARASKSFETIQWTLPYRRKCPRGITVIFSAGTEAEIYLA